VEVYNCATGSADCSQCLGREDLGHRCVWSEGSSSCRLHGELPPVSDFCPAPEIRKVRPQCNAEGARGVAMVQRVKLAAPCLARGKGGRNRALSLAQDRVETSTALLPVLLSHLSQGPRASDRIQS